MLAEMVGAEEFLRLIAFAEFVHVGQMVPACVPVWLGKVLEFGTAVATDVCIGDCTRGTELAVRIVRIVRENGCRGVECSFVVFGQSCT